MEQYAELAEKIIATNLKVWNALQTTQHPDKNAAIWAMGNFANSLPLGILSKKPYSSRMEGNALAALCFRNGPIEDVHSGDSELDDKEMKIINIWSSRALTGALALKEICLSLGGDGNEFWQHCVVAYHHISCTGWETTHKPPKDRT